MKPFIEQKNPQLVVGPQNGKSSDVQNYIRNDDTYNKITIM